jgi:copper oxidase (laccase) domain-containing protein
VGAARRGGVRSDALLAPVAQQHLGVRVAYGVITADCVPIVVRSARGWGVIHAGWRGLACGVIGRAVEALGEVSEAVIFASAGGTAYEVGPEVVESIGGTAVVAAAPGGQGKAFLDTADTARRQLEQVVPSAHVAVAGICTMSDRRFHSFRRDGGACGRAVTFIVPDGVA